MNASMNRRINVASCWASTRIAVLDGFQQYEDSYAITQEFREWITCIEESPEGLKNSVLPFPHHLENDRIEETRDSDEPIEI